LKAGSKTSLVEQQRANLFTTFVANIGPGETIMALLPTDHVFRIVERLPRRHPGLHLSPFQISASLLHLIRTREPIITQRSIRLQDVGR